MKKILLFLMLIVAFASMNTAKAQCDLAISNLTFDQIDPNDPTKVFQNPVTGNCEVKFTVHFDITTNSGFKFLFFHSWLANDYPNPSIFDCTPGANTNATPPGEANKLGTSISQAGTSILDFGFIGLKDFLATKPAGPTVYTITDLIATGAQYPNNNGHGVVALNTAASAKVTKVSSSLLHFDITDIQLIFPGLCNQVLNVKTDVWGTNIAGTKQYDATAQNFPTPNNDGTNSSISAQCWLCKQNQTLNDPTVSLTKFCEGTQYVNGGFQYDISIATASVSDIQVTYKLYAHDPLDLNPLPNPATDPLVFPSAFGPFTINNVTPYAPPGIFNLPSPYCCIEPWASWGIYAVVTQIGVQSSVISNLADVSCATLPVNLKSFTAVRKNASNVDLKWETAQEENSKGFYVERKLSNGGWQPITFVETKATHGNSSSPLTYEFTDLNNAKGISQYRLRQIDIDGKQAFSLIRSVRGEGQKSNTIIYPNPSGDGKVNIVFDSGNSARNVSLMDVSGKTLKQWKGVTNNTIQVDNLNSGFYTVRIVNVETGEQVVEKFIVNKR
jgi:hypothetical protein